MGEPQFAPNHTVDPATGFLESNGFIDAFNAEKKLNFLKTYKAYGLSLYKACEALHIKDETITKHLRKDEAFHKAFRDAERDYADELEGVSRINALNPKSVIERIFQLKSLFPSKYGDNKQASTMNVTLSIDGKTLDLMAKRSQVIDAEVINSTPEIDDIAQRLGTLPNAGEGTADRPTELPDGEA